MTKILLVEDDKSLREIYGVRLLAEGYDIVSAGDGEEALAMAIKERPQLIVSDVMMPKISGFDMLDILRSTTETKDIKVIMMTALSSDDQRARGEALGADRYLVKSQVGIEDVVRTVHDVLGDAPTSTASATQTFGGPAPSAAPRPATTGIPPRPGMQPSPFSSAPQPPTPTTAPTTAPSQAQGAPQPRPSAPYNAGGTRPNPAAAPTTSPSSAPAAPATPHSLPQPTAPFSTSRPANLGDRIIHPITPAQPKEDINTLMAKELSEAPSAPEVPIAAPSSPAPQVTPATPSTSSQPSMPSAPELPPQPPTPPVPTSVPHPGANDISFEETPRQAPPSAPFTPGPQPPSAS